MFGFSRAFLGVFVWILAADIKMPTEGAVTQWVFTYQLEEEEDAEGWLKRQFETGAYSYLVGQMEQAPTTGQLHIQGYAQLTKAKRLTGMKKLDARAHWEHCRCPAEARAYAMKTDTRLQGPWEFGEPRNAGRKATLKEVCEQVLEGKSDYDISRAAPEQFARHHKGIGALRIAARVPTERRTWKPELWVIWGNSGAGKSWFAQLNWGDVSTVYWKPQGTKWWDGYYGQETVVLDDFKGSWMPLQDLQRLVDRYPLLVETKGGYTPMLARRIVITSNPHPSRWYANDDHGTVMRRIRDFAHGRFVEAIDLDHWYNSEVEPPCVWMPPADVKVPGSAALLAIASSQEPGSDSATA